MHHAVVRDHLLAANTARHCVSRHVRSRCAAYEHEKRAARKEAKAKVKREKAAKLAADADIESDDAAESNREEDDDAAERIAEEADTLGSGMAAEKSAQKRKIGDDNSGTLNNEDLASAMDEGGAVDIPEGSGARPRKRQIIEIPDSDFEEDF